jgi:serine/threonine protein kinase
LLDSRFEPVIGGLWLAQILKDPFQTTEDVGAPMFKAPELLMGESYDCSVDVFAFAILICNLFEPLKTSSMTSYGIAQLITRGDRWPRPNGMYDALWQLVNECWEQDPKKRPTFTEIVERLQGSVDLTFPGTDLDAYKEFQGRLAQERVPDPRPVEMLEVLCDLLGWDDARDCVS